MTARDRFTDSGPHVEVLTYSGAVSALTTTDNPYDPYTQWREWLAWDRQAGYHTPGLLARILDAAGADFDDEAAIEDAIDRIVALNVSGVHRKVTEPASATDVLDAAR